MLAAIERRDGSVVLTGEAGSGKTTLCRLVIDELDARTFTSLVLDSFVTIEDLLKRVLIDFGVISHADLAGGRLSVASSQALTIALKEFLQSLVPLNAFAVIFVDDAHNLATEILAQVRRLSALERDKQLIQLVLVGEPALLTRLGRPDAHQFGERQTVRCSLGPLTEDEIAGYVIHRLVVSGGGPSRVEFDGGALTMIYQNSRGIPRLVNRICDRALTLGYEQSASVINAALVEAAAHDLDLITPQASSARAWRLGVAAVALAGLMLLGASAATWVFDTRVQRVVRAWQAIPSLPAPPSPRMVRPVVVQVPDAHGELPKPSEPRR
jgi:general secretion pathway protein A